MVELRHYCIRGKPSGVSRPIRKLVTVTGSGSKQLPNLGRMHSIEDFVLGGPGAGGALASDSEAEDDGARVELS